MKAETCSCGAVPLSRANFIKGALALAASPLLRYAPAHAAEAGVNVMEVAPGVFVHQGRYELQSPENRGDMANAGFVVGGESVAVIDTSGSAVMGRELRDAIRAVTGKPIKLIGTGEKWDALEDFHPERIAGRILGMGDVVGLVEKAIQTVEIDKAEAIARKVKKGAFDLDDLAEQLKQMQKLGGMGGVLAMLPGIGKIKKQLDAANLDDKILKRQQAMIGSMTKAERKNPKLLNASRKKRVASGSGTSVQEINRLVKMHRQMADMMKTVGKKRGLLGSLFGGGPPPELPAELPQGGSLPQGKLPPFPASGLPGLPGNFPGLPGGLPRGLPGLPGSKKR